MPPQIFAGDDKNGVSPTTISLPSGPGSIEGLGESFQPLLNTGSARYAVKITLPAGPAGHGPSLALQYDSGLGFSSVAPGWNFEPGSIRRSVDKGLPRYIDQANGLDDDADGEVDEIDEIDIIVGPDGEELVELDDGSYRARIEGGFNRFRRVGGGWQVDLKNGTCLTYGLDPGGGGRISEAGLETYRWLLEKSADVNGNAINYHWTSLPGSDRQKFLQKIRYGPGTAPWAVFHFVRFNYELRPDWRLDCRSGFVVKTAHRLTSIDIGIQGHLPDLCAVGDWNQDGTPDALISRYRLEYAAISPAQEQLVRITRYGADGTTPLPPTSFTYARCQPAGYISAAAALIGAVNPPEQVMDNDRVDLIDLNRDALPDILHTDFTGGQHLVYLNQGPVSVGDRKQIQWSPPTAIGSPDGLANFLHLDDPLVNLADMNGDGLSDLVHTAINAEVSYFVNRGNLGWANKALMSIQDTSPPAPFSADNIKTADLDFNKRMDVVRSSTGGYTTWFNYADGVYSQGQVTAGAVYQETVIDLADEGVDLADMNGDRLNDVIQVTPVSVICCYGLGHGRFAAGVSLPIPDILLTDGEDSQITRAKLTDINCDGLADLVIERANSNQLWFWLNLGNQGFADRTVVTDLPLSFGSSPAVRWVDINGNGSTDLVYADSAAGEKIQALDICELICSGVHPHLLTTIDNGLGRVTTISYQSSTTQALAAASAGQPWNSSVPFPVAVVSQVEVNSNVDLDLTPGADIYSKSFVYRDGFYDDLERQFRGFAEVTVTEPGDETIPAAVTVSQFFTGGSDGVSNDEDEDIDELSNDNHREEEALKGLVKALEKRDGNGKLYSREENDWEIRTLPLTNPADREIRLALNSESRKLIYEGGETPKTIHNSRVYDNYGNVILLLENGDLEQIGDERRTYTDYINDETNWLIGLPYHQLLTDAADQRCRESYTYYDGVKFLGLAAGQATAGHISRQRAWVTADDWINLLRSEYDQYGNIITALNPRGARREIAWDPLLHIFPNRETIEVATDQPDLVIEADYNYGLGVMTSSRDFNDHETAYRYDIFSRLVAMILPGDSEILPTAGYHYRICDPLRGLLYSYDVAGNLTQTATSLKFSRIETAAREVSGQTGTLDSIQLVDGMGRKIAGISEAEAGGIVSDMALFNARGLTRFAFLPFQIADLAADPQPDPDLPHNELTYDGLGRNLQSTTPPDENGVKDVTSLSYQPLSTTTTDARDHLKTTVSDGLERLFTVAEHNDAEIYTTRYAYDAVSNLLSVTDHHNNLKTMLYDGLGRRTQLSDPDRGRMEYAYDTASNLIRTRDSKQQETVYEYDLANRLIGKDYLDDAGLSPDITYLYDRPAADYPTATNLTGRLAAVYDLSGAAFSSYDDRGNNDWYVIRVADGEVAADFRFASAYDALGRVTAQTFPDGDRLTYNYNSRGLLSEVPGFAALTAYHVGGGIENVAFENLVTTSNRYDPRHRLLDTSTSPATGDALRDLHYRFDPTNNISAIEDLRPIAPDLPEYAGQTFVYDDLNRLTRAQGPGYGLIDFQYDAIGNMTSKSSPDSGDQHIDDDLVNLKGMTYGGGAGKSDRGERQPGDAPGPHALTATASGLVYDYDDNGNVIVRDGKTFEWDFDDRLQRSLSSSTTTSYLYNAAGQRIIKKVARDDTIETTWYVDDGFEIREGQVEKYVFAGSRRIARVDGRLSTVGDEIKQLLILEQGYNFVGVEVESAAAEIAAALGAGAEIWIWDNGDQDYLGYIPAASRYDFTTLIPGRGYLVKAPQALTMMLTGLRSLPQFELLSGWNLVAAFSDHSLSMTEVQAATGYRLQALWYYETQTGTWHSFTPGRAPFLNDLKTMSPGRAYWLQLSEAFDLETTAEPPAKQFYHPDHLGSAGLVTDNNGAVIERVEYYPYGRPRYESRLDFDSPYKYTDKELDKETGLMYYEARYYDPVIGRFMSVDPLLQNIPIRVLDNPQKLNTLCYATNNPILKFDPTGLEEDDVQEEIHYEKTYWWKFKEKAAQYKDKVKKLLGVNDPDPNNCEEFNVSLPGSFAVNGARSKDGRGRMGVSAGKDVVDNDVLQLGVEAELGVKDVRLGGPSNEDLTYEVSVTPYAKLKAKAKAKLKNVLNLFSSDPENISRKGGEIEMQNNSSLNGSESEVEVHRPYKVRFYFTHRKEQAQKYKKAMDAVDAN